MVLEQFPKWMSCIDCRDNKKRKIYRQIWQEKKSWFVFIVPIKFCWFKNKLSFLCFSLETKYNGPSHFR